MFVRTSINSIYSIGNEYTVIIKSRERNKHTNVTSDQRKRRRRVRGCDAMQCDASKEVCG